MHQPRVARSPPWQSNDQDEAETKLRKINFRKETIPHNREVSYLQMRLTARRAGLTLLDILGSVLRGGRRRRSARLATAPELSPEKGSGYLKRLSAPASDLNQPMISLLLLLLHKSAKCGHVRFGSKADIGVGPRHVRFTPKSGHSAKGKAPPPVAPVVTKG